MYSRLEYRNTHGAFFVGKWHWWDPLFGSLHLLRVIISFFTTVNPALSSSLPPTVPLNPFWSPSIQTWLWSHIAHILSALYCSHTRWHATSRECERDPGALCSQHFLTHWFYGVAIVHLQPETFWLSYHGYNSRGRRRLGLSLAFVCRPLSINVWVWQSFQVTHIFASLICVSSTKVRERDASWFSLRCVEMCTAVHPHSCFNSLRAVNYSSASMWCIIFIINLRNS